MIFEFLKELNPVIMIVLAILIFFSIGSWGIMFYKILMIRKVRRITKKFVDFFWETKDFDAINSKIGDFEECPLALVFKAGYKETEHFLNIQTDINTGRITTDLSAIDNISRSLRKISSMEIEKMEKNIGFLATTGATTPFIGLFGTVWGIMRAFDNIKNAGSTSLEIVAPGISEALITTAIGLAVAIPAVIGFNYIQGKIRSLVSEIDNFTYDFLNIVQKIFSSKNN
jgi:biopolymer transport protein TolQ